MTQDQTTGPDAAAETPAPWRPSRTVAVVLAGGTGTRLGLGIPKQLLKIAGKPIIEHTLAVFEARPGDRRDHRADGHRPRRDAQQIVDKAGFRKVTKVIEGGETRNATTRRRAGRGRRRRLQHPLPRRGAPAAQRPDRARVRQRALDATTAVDVAIPSADTIIQVDDGRLHHRHPGPLPAAPRARPRRRSAPGTIREAYRHGRGRPGLRRHRRLRRGAALPARHPDQGDRRSRTRTSRSPTRSTCTWRTSSSSSPPRRRPG